MGERQLGRQLGRQGGLGEKHNGVRGKQWYLKQVREKKREGTNLLRNINRKEVSFLS